MTPYKTQAIYNGSTFHVTYGPVSLGKYDTIAKAHAALTGADLILQALKDGTLLQGQSLADFLETAERPDKRIQTGRSLKDHPLLKRTQP